MKKYTMLTLLSLSLAMSQFAMGMINGAIGNANGETEHQQILDKITEIKNHPNYRCETDEKFTDGSNFDVPESTLTERHNWFNSGSTVVIREYENLINDDGEQEGLKETVTTCHSKDSSMYTKSNAAVIAALASVGILSYMSKNQINEFVQAVQNGRVSLYPQDIMKWWYGEQAEEEIEAIERAVQ